ETIISDLLCQKSRKTLFIIDEHGKLFSEDYSKTKPDVLHPLVDLTSWGEAKIGARVVFTGTAHSGYERKYIPGDIKHWVVFVVPLSDTIFDKLLSLSPMLSRDAVRNEVKRITNNVPRELAKLMEYIGNNDKLDDEILELIKEFQLERCKNFTRNAESYFKMLDKDEQKSQRGALSKMFRPDVNGA